MSLGLSRMRALCDYLDNPERKLRVIHVAGTNGKGSVAAYISSILGVSGYLTGRYVSPAVICEEEFIQFEDSRGVTYMNPELLTECVEETEAAVRRMKADGFGIPTSFEFETAVAFLAFMKRGCQAAVVEAGLGGAEDATNVIEAPLISVITPIGMDHMSVLGSTIEEIAAQKAGIIKENTPVIAYQTSEEAKAVLERTCLKKNAPLTFVEEADMERLRTDLRGSLFSYRGEHFQTRMAGCFQMENACLALEACRNLGDKFLLDTVKCMVGIREAYWPGRFDVVSAEPLIIVDGAHNADGACALRRTLEAVLPGARIHGIMGAFRDKEYREIIAIMRPVMYDVITVTPKKPRGLPAEELKEAWMYGGLSLVETADGVNEGIKKMAERCREGDAIVIFGSLSLAGELRWKV